MYEVEMYELTFPSLNLLTSFRNTGKKPLPETYATSFPLLFTHVRSLAPVATGDPSMFAGAAIHPPDSHVSQLNRRI